MHSQFVLCVYDCVCVYNSSRECAESSKSSCYLTHSRTLNTVLTQTELFISLLCHFLGLVASPSSLLGRFLFHKSQHCEITLWHINLLHTLFKDETLRVLQDRTYQASVDGAWSWQPGSRCVQQMLMLLLINSSVNMSTDISILQRWIIQRKDCFDTHLIGTVLHCWPVSSSMGVRRYKNLIFGHFAQLYWIIWDWWRLLLSPEASLQKNVLTTVLSLTKVSKKGKVLPSCYISSS